ncbi:MAG: FtsK/SpoIIIE domain-containing protein [Planctomycetaceae bacterium]
MNQDQAPLTTLVPLLERLRSNCEQYDQINRTVSDQLFQMDAAENESREQILQHHRTASETVLRQIEDEFTSRCRIIEETADSQRSTTLTERQNQINEQSTAFEQAKTAHVRALESELWVLQSVCDENGEDTPVSQYQKARSIFLNRQTDNEQALESISSRMKDAKAFLARCHTGMDDTPLTPNLKPARADVNLEHVVVESNTAHAAVDKLFGLKSTGLLIGLRPFVMAILITLAVAIPVTTLKADLRSFVNPEITSPDWGWLGVSFLIGGGAAALLVGTLVLTTQSKLRSFFEQIQQSASNAQHAAATWKTQTERELIKMRKSAKRWQKEMTNLRDKHTQALHGGADSQLEEMRRQLNHNTNIIAQYYDQQIVDIEARRDRDQQMMNQWKQTETARMTEHLRGELTAALQKLESDIQHQSETLKTHREQVLQRWEHESKMAIAIANGSTAAVGELNEWPHLRDGTWTAPEYLPEAIPAGRIDFTISLPPQDNATPVKSSISLPAVLRFPSDTSILVQHDAASRETALEFVRAILLKLLTTITPGRVQFTLIDPVGLGQSFSAMMHMADFDELLIGSRIWTDATQIRDRLQKVTEHMENVFQTYLRSEFETIEQYNASAGEVAEPYHFVVVAGFPTGISEEASRHLSSILTSGPRCGVHAIITHDPSIPAPRLFDLNVLRNQCLTFRAGKGQVEFQTEEPVQLKFTALKPPESGQYVAIVRAVGEKSKNARRVEVSFSRIAPSNDQIWSLSTADGIDLPIGRAGAARLQYLRLGRGTSQHIMIAGKTGSGKSTLLHILITNLALHYSPNEIQFFLIDFKKGVEFRTYAANQLPHAKVIAIESDREFGLSVLERLDEILQERGELFRSRGVQDVPSFREKFPNETMPRLLLLIDEFQEFFVAEDRVSSRASLLLDRLVRQGRAFGVHVILGSQTLGGAYSLARSTLGQVAVRIALQCSEGDAHLILSEENSAARLLTRPGEAIYNDANGMTEGNHPFQIAWMTERRREQAIQDMLQYDRKHAGIQPLQSESRMIVFEGNVAPSAELCGPLNAWLASETDATRRVSEYLPIWIGEPVAIASPVCVELRRASGQNLLIVGQDTDLADSILLMSALACFHPNHQGQFILLHDQRDREAVTRMTEMLAVLNSPVYSMRTVTETDAVISELHQKLILRETTIADGEKPEIVCAIRNLGQFRTLRRDDDEYGFGGFGERKPETTSSLLTDLIKRGPLVGIHLIIWSDTYSNATRWLANSMMREFEYRIAFRMNQTDSASLLDTPVASSLSPGRAILYRDQTGTADKFRPFAWPTTKWLRNQTGADEQNRLGTTTDEVVLPTSEQTGEITLSTAPSQSAPDIQETAPAPATHANTTPSEHSESVIDSGDMDDDLEAFDINSITIE